MTASSRRALVEWSSLLIAFALFWIRGTAYLYWRFPHEDSFILFRYAEHLAGGAGIVFNVGGPHAEGATDFLYMLGLAGFVRLGLDVALAAVWLNALACGALGWLVARAWRRAEGAYALPLLLAAFWPFVGAAHASCDGFGTLFYSAAVAACLQVFDDRSAAAHRWLPFMALALGLCRPDGAILGASFYAARLLLFRGDASARRILLSSGWCAAALGLGYFGWRCWYFGELLPLPLYVKSTAWRAFPGLRENAAWFRSAHGPLVPLAVGASFVVVLARGAKARVVGIVAGLAPAAVLLASLAVAQQWQNVEFRFQAPAYALTLLTVIQLAAEVFRRAASSGFRWLVPAACVTAYLPALLVGKVSWPIDYMDSFAVRIAPALTGKRVALTEAGRLAYWSRAEVHDMVGLNEARTARAEPTVSYVAELNPDLILFHVAGTLDFKKLRLERGNPATDRVVEVDGSSLGGAVRPSYRCILRRDCGPTLPHTKVAAVVLAETVRQGGWRVFGVRYGGDFSHVIAARTDTLLERRLASELEAAPLAPPRSYAEAKRFAPSLAPWVARYFGG